MTTAVRPCQVTGTPESGGARQPRGRSVSTAVPEPRERRASGPLRPTGTAPLGARSPGRAGEGGGNGVGVGSLGVVAPRPRLHEPAPHPEAPWQE